ncbi:hypothetical protein HmCmsJML021_02995 [Escherichia coli]|nr:hypothetical protein HmCmsJML021_02995 [Escherichia coli]
MTMTKLKISKTLLAVMSVCYTHLRAHETEAVPVCLLSPENTNTKKKKKKNKKTQRKKKNHK